MTCIEDLKVLISRTQHEELLRDQLLLSYLYSEGLQDWEGFNRAIKKLRDDVDAAMEKKP